ncbi:MAG: hypothetical protein Fur0046_36040 [Cyanobacteria bacterium J069]|nr:MAG: hypothetical protein D6742_09240 [Cyanobacteria bacterium J069]
MSLKFWALSAVSAVATTVLISTSAAASPCIFGKAKPLTTLTDSPTAPADVISQSPNANQMGLVGGGIAAIAALAGGAFALRAYRARQIQPSAQPEFAAAEEALAEAKPFAIVVPAIALERPMPEALDADPVLSDRL